MSKISALQVLYAYAGGDPIDLLQRNAKYRHKLALVEPVVIRRFVDGGICEPHQKKIRRKLTIEGEDNPPDVYQLPLNATLRVTTGVRFYSQLGLPESVDPKSVMQAENGPTSYRITIDMVSVNFTVEIEEVSGAMKWQWSLEEV